MKLVCIVFCSVFLSVAAIAGEHSDFPSGSAMDTGLGHNEENEKYEKLMSKSLENIKSQLKEICSWCTAEAGDSYNLFEQIQKQQDSWRVYAKEECELMYNLESPPRNTWASSRWSRCVSGQAYTRLRQVRRVEACLVRNKNVKDFYFQSCIEQLSPLIIQKM
jgi:hypothetical protein